MIATDELVKKFDNIYPVKATAITLLRNDGTSEVRTLLDIDYERADKIRATMTPTEKERQRSIV